MISLILPIHNVQKYIAECLESVIGQTHEDIEIICVNDFSMDNSATIVKEYAKRDKRIRLIHNEKNRGLGGARNAGMDMALGEYIIFVDTDDMMRPAMVQELLKSIEETGADLVFCNIYLLNADGTLQHHVPLHDPLVFNGKREFLLPNDIMYFIHAWPSAWNKIYKKSIIDKYHIRYHENMLYEDHTFYYEYLFKCGKAHYLEKYLYVYRHKREGSIMSEVSPRIFDVFTVLDAIEGIFNNVPAEIRDIVMQRLAIRLLWERTNAFRMIGGLERKFIRRSQFFLKKYKHTTLMTNKDWFIPEDAAILETPIARLRKFFLRVLNIY